MKRRLVLAFSHLAVLAGGYGIHRVMAPPEPVVIAAAPAPAPAPIPAVRPQLGVGSSPGESPWTAGELRKAWHALAGAKLPPAELAILRDKMRREWLAKDLRSALLTWADEETLDETELSNTIREQLKGHEEELLDWILAGDFGLDGCKLLGFWARAVGASHPDLLLAGIAKVPREYQEPMIDIALRSELDDPGIDERISKISALPEEHLRVFAWKAMLKGVLNNAEYNSGPDRFHDLLSRPDVPAEARGAALVMLAEKIAQSQQPARSLEAFRALSDEDKGAIGPALLDQAKRYGFAYDSNVPNVLSMLAESGQWELISGRGAETVDVFYKSGKPNPEAMSRWALQLPGREETAGTFRSAVAGRFREDPAAGMAWILTLAEGWHREQALAQFAMTADAHHHNAAMRDEALRQIADPGLQEEIREWRRKEAKAK